MDKSCSFCNLEKSGFKTIFQTINMAFFEHRTSPLLNHYVLVTSKHIPDEAHFDKYWGNEYIYAIKKANDFIQEKHKKEPLSITNPASLQAVLHFQRHFIASDIKAHKVMEALDRVMRQI